MKKIISKSILLTIGVIGINFGFKIYLSYHISKENIGIFYTMLDIASVFFLFFSGYKDSMIKAVSDGTFDYIYKKIFQNYLLMTLLCIVILYYIYANLNSTVLDPRILIVFFIMTQISNYYSYLNVSYRNYNSMLFEKTIKAVALVLSFTLLREFMSNIMALIFSYIIQLLIHIIYLFLTSRKIFYIKPKKIKKDLYKIFIKNYTLSTITSFLGSITLYLSAIIMFYLFENSGELSEYQVVVKSIFFALITVFVHPVSAYTFPELSKFIAQNNFDEVKRIDTLLKKYLSLFMILIFFSTLFTKIAIGAIFPSNYINSYEMLNVLLPMLSFIIYTSFAINIIKAFDRFDLALYVRLVGSILFFISVYIFYLLKFDAKCIVYSLDISFLGMFLLSYFYKKRLLS